MPDKEPKITEKTQILLVGPDRNKLASMLAALIREKGLKPIIAKEE